MNFVDGIIIIFILLAAVAGFKRGVIRETIGVVGNFLCLVLAFLFMPMLANFFYDYVPFLSLGLFDITLSALNILVYQIVSFAICYLILTTILRLVMSITNIVDKLINALIIFTIPSKILGAVVGLISGYITVFVILLVLSIPFSNAKYVSLHESKLNNFILNNTIILSGITKPITNTTSDIYTLSVKISKDDNRVANSNEYNLKMLDLMMKYKIVNYDTVNKLIDNGKLNDIRGYEKVVDKYK